MIIRKQMNLADFISFYIRYIAMFNNLDITLQDINLLRYFLLLPDKYQYARFSLPAKKQVRELALQDGWKLSKQAISNRLYALNRKGVLRRDTDGVLYFSEALLKPIIEFKNTNKINLNAEITNINKEY